jgi:hypothetical protein
VLLTKIFVSADKALYCRRDAKLAVGLEKQRSAESKRLSTKVLPAWPGGQIENSDRGQKLTTERLIFDLLGLVWRHPRQKSARNSAILGPWMRA